MKRKLGIYDDSLWCDGISSIDALKLFKSAGFDCFATYLHTVERAAPVVEFGNKIGLPCDNIHAPIIRRDLDCNDNGIWDTDSYKHKYVMDWYRQSIDTAAACGIPKVVLHLFTTLVAPEISDEGLARFDDVVEYAQKKGVTLAFENLYHFGILAYMAERYQKIPNVGFCYDFGHEASLSLNRYAEGLRWMDLFRNRLATTHIHDNFGAKDLLDRHMLPYDGSIDYAPIIKKLDEYNYEGPLILEVYHELRKDLSPEEFVQTGFERLKKLSEL